MVRRVDDDPVDVAGPFQSHQFPRRPAVDAAVHPTATGVAIAWIAFPCSCPNHIRVGRSNGHGPNALGGLVVKQRFPFDPRRFGSPESPTRRADVNDLRPVALNINGGNAAAHGSGPDVPHVHAFDDGVYVLGKSQSRPPCQQEREPHCFDSFCVHHN